LKKKKSLHEKTKGIYLLVLRLRKRQEISAGKLSKTTFLPGIYLYVGRAREGLAGRIRRHLRKEKKLFWHIDYFLQRAEIEDIWIKKNDFDECQVARSIENYVEGAFPPLKKFGSSDCRCPSHLIFVPNKKHLASLRKKMAFQRIEQDEYHL
jgi:Uri superfamily endonuclease